MSVDKSIAADTYYVVNHQIRLSPRIDKLYVTLKTKCHSYLCSSTTMDHIPSRQSETPRTTQSTQIIADLHQAHSENLNILQSPQPPTDCRAFHHSLEDTQGWVDMLDTRGNTEQLVGQHLAEQQEIIAYRTSRLRTAVEAWSNALYCDDYAEWWGCWLTGLLGEVVSHYLVGVIGLWTSGVWTSLA
jgi:hypothetical protein